MAYFLGFVFLFALSLIGVCLTLWLQERHHQSAVMASAVSVVIGAILLYPIGSLNPFDFNTSLSLLMGASFVGMSNPNRLNTFFKKIFVSLAYVLCFFFLIDKFQGFGGALGATAGLVVFFSYALFGFMDKPKRKSDQL